MQILYAVAALGGVALVFGALLGVVARFLPLNRIPAWKPSGSAARRKLRCLRLCRL